MVRYPVREPGRCHFIRPVIRRHRARWGELLVSPFREFSGIFGPDELALFQQAYDEACRELKLDSDPHSQRMRKVVATAVLDAARLGERDPAALKAYALAVTMRALRVPKK